MYTYYARERLPRPRRRVVESCRWALERSGYPTIGPHGSLQVSRHPTRSNSFGVFSIIRHRWKTRVASKRCEQSFVTLPGHYI